MSGWESQQGERDLRAALRRVMGRWADEIRNGPNPRREGLRAALADINDTLGRLALATEDGPAQTDRGD